MIVIVDYGLGNLRSIQNMLHRAAVTSVISNDPDVVRSADKLILPGVGHFQYGMNSLRERGLIDLLNERVIEARTPILGICLGAQLLGRGSEEGDARGLGWVPMDTVAFDRARLLEGEKVPHMGWTDTTADNSPLFEGLIDQRFYYVHSFHFKCDRPEIVVCTAHHGYRFASGIVHGNVVGVQFHPEKSHVFGRKLLRNFAAMSFGR